MPLKDNVLSFFLSCPFATQIFTYNDEGYNNNNNNSNNNFFQQISFNGPALQFGIYQGHFSVPTKLD